eukprot:Unigene2038_Nuclearia_a/m.6348 Unigene2038_Nuclearia_a/g.6348  ORF Unigene2038_Nuclearia_a/g.6348 Unigene2038_Nuclearia_a/m.6348 type:complete len:203 (-) Unigene2038_Nuclearia_a:74-682(-)
MNYLVIEGYKEAAEHFSAETGLKPAGDLGAIGDRMRIRSALQAGRVDEAVEMVNDLNPEILDTDAHLFFHLQLQKLIELIRQGDLAQALTFAQEELAPRGEEHPQFLEELERTMALLAFEDQSKSPVGSLLDQTQRQKLASEVNAAILTAQSQEKDARLPGLLKMLLWAQTLLDERYRYPRIGNLLMAALEPVPGAPGDMAP